MTIPRFPSKFLELRREHRLVVTYLWPFTSTSLPRTGSKPIPSAQQSIAVIER